MDKEKIVTVALILVIIAVIIMVVLNELGVWEAIR